MTRFTSLQTGVRAGVTVSALLMSTAAWADLTSQQVWNDWKQYMEGMGYAVSANESANGGDLTVADIAMSMQLPDNAGNMTMTMGTLNFVQNGAAVDIVMPNVMPITIGATDGRDNFKMSFEYTQAGQKMTASGTPEKATYDYSADTISLNLAQLEVEGDTFGQDNAKVVMTGTGVSSSTTMTIADLRTYEQTGAIETLVYDLAINPPDEPVTVKMNGNLDGLTFGGGGAIPLEKIDYTDMAAMMKAGFAADGQITYTAGATHVEVEDPENGNFVGDTSSQGGELNVKMNATELSYGGQQRNVSVSAQAAQLPFPVEMSMAESGFNLSMPISKSDDPQGFAFGIKLGDFVMSDLIWSIFDPTAQLPRDPATIDLDLTGQAKMFVDIMDPESAASAPVPGELQALSLNRLLVSAAGAKLEGNGDFTFDNTDLTSFDGIPKPVGAVNLALAGGNGLMDKLVAMGLLPEEQAMGARMMMGLFAVPGDAPDTLKSTVEFTQEGQVLANGQRIK